MLNYLFLFAMDLFDEVFNNPLMEIVPLSFLFVVGIVLLNMLKRVA